MNKHILLAAALLLCGAPAAAQSVSVSSSVNINVDFPIVQPTAELAVRLVALGTTVALLSAGGAVVATVTPAGYVVPVAGYDPSMAVNVRVVTTQGSGIVVREVYPLAVKLPKKTKVRLETIQVRGPGRAVPVVAVMKRQNDAVRGKKGHAKGHGKNH